MSEQPPNRTGSSFLRKKVGGVPVIYLAGGTVAVLAVVAFTMKRNAPAADEPVVVEGDDPGTILSEGEVYPSMPSGSVTGTAPSSELPNTSIETNDEWIKRGVAFLVVQGMSGGAAQSVLQKYLDGQQLSYDEGVIRDKVIRELGLPPTLLPTGGTSPKPVKPAPVIPKLPPVIPKKPPVHPPTKTNPVPKQKDTTPGRPSIPFPGKNLGVGSSGAPVRHVQRVTHSVQDGKFDHRTATHVSAWQKAHSLPATGVVDNRTWNRMFP